MPTVTELELFAVDLPFRVAFRHAAATRLTSESLFLRTRLDGGAEGWGECLPRAYVSGESREEAFALLRDTVLPALVGRAFGSLTDVVSFLEKCDGKAPPEWVAPEVPQSSAWCGVDLSLIDAFGHAARGPVRLGVPERGTSAGPPRRIRGTAAAHPLQRRRLGGARTALRGVAAQDARLRLSAGQA
jgi:L-alanine-DL-glutamate epimerase-like enolase superfamily enzyme